MDEDRTARWEKLQESARVCTHALRRQFPFAGGSMPKTQANRRNQVVSLPPPPITLEDLKTLYDECNESRFGGRLPKVRRGRRGPRPKAGPGWGHPAGTGAAPTPP